MDKKLYNENSIESLDPRSFTRLKPQVYCGDTTYSTQLLVEIFANSVDEFNLGHGDFIDINIDKDIVTVRDYGQGFIPNSFREDGKTILEAAFSVLNTSGKYREDGTYEGNSLGSYGIGAKLPIFLSARSRVETYRNGEYEKIFFNEGIFDKRQSGKIVDGTPTGTLVQWMPSKEFFTHTEVDLKKVKDLIKTTTCLCEGLKVNLTVNGKKEVFFSSNGLNDLIDDAVKGKEIIKNRFGFKNEENKFKINFLLTYTKNNSSTIIPYVNTGLTESGPHITQIKSLLTKEFNKFFREKDWLKEKDANLTGDEVQDGMYLVFNITSTGVAYDAQVKSRVTKLDMKPFSPVISQNFADWLEINENQVKKIFDKAVLMRKAKEAAKKAKNTILEPKENKRKTLKEKLAISEKFIDCQNKNPKNRELLLVEGLSAGSACVEARDPKSMAIMMLRGKVINALKSSKERVLANQEYHDIIESIGAGFDETFDVSKCKFNRILIATDADPDGSGIAQLLLTFFWTYMRPLILEGKVYRVLTPLYTATYKGKKYFLYNENELAEFRKGKNEKDISLKHAKGLGENNASELKEFVFDVHNYEQIVVKDEKKADELFNILMGKDVEPRKDFLYENANFMEEF